MKKDLSKLNSIQRYVTQENGTEAPYENEFWDFFEEGVYLDIVSGEVLFSSTHKFQSDCGWPAFYKVLERDNIIRHEDKSGGISRIEVRSTHGDSHLGHVFTDGPAPTGIRYCINSAALKFIPKASLKSVNLDQYHSLFDKEVYKHKGELEYATFGAGCFWGVEAIFARTPGVIDAVSGYSGGDIVDPTYEQVSTGKSGHAEVVQVQFDPAVISYKELLDLFFRMHDPTTQDAQGYDVGPHYRSAIFTHSEDQNNLALAEIKKFNGSDLYPNEIVTQVTGFTTFYPAEEYHQDYYEKKYAGGHGPICHFVRGE